MVIRQVSRWIQRYIGQLQRKAEVYKENLRQSVRRRKTTRKCVEQSRLGTVSSSLSLGEGSVSFQATDQIISLNSAKTDNNQGKRLIKLNYKVKNE